MSSRVAIDAMGGDYAPVEIVKGAIDALDGTDIDILLVGRENVIKSHLAGLSYDALRVSIINAPDVINMDDHPTEVLRKKTASLSKTAEIVAQGDADVMVSAGNTGATMVAARKHFGLIEHIDRPAIATLIPSLKGKTVLLDSGANIDCKPNHLLGFAFMGSVYALTLFGIPNPRIGLLSVGEEPAKGNDVTKKTFSLLEVSGLNFIGNVEGRDINAGSVDVVVCDGFIGNIILKFGEGLVSFLRTKAKQNLKSHWWRIPAALGISSTYKELKRECDYAETGGAPLLGLKKICIISHGSSRAYAISNAIKTADKIHKNNFVHEFKIYLKDASIRGVDI